jgi:hypothetical protein
VDRLESQVLAARWRLGDIADLRTLVGELLDAGEDTPALIELFTLPEDAVSGDVFERALVELGAPAATDADDGQIVAAWLARSVVDGSIGARDACERGARIYVASTYEQNAFEPYYDFADDYGWGRRGDEEIDAEVRRFAEALVASAS